MRRTERRARSMKRAPSKLGMITETALLMLRVYDSGTSRGTLGQSVFSMRSRMVSLRDAWSEDQGLT